MGGGTDSREHFRGIYNLRQKVYGKHIFVKALHNGSVASALKGPVIDWLVPVLRKWLKFPHLPSGQAKQATKPSDQD